MQGAAERAANPSRVRRGARPRACWRSTLRLVPGEEFGRYRIEAEIGRGGQAVVYRATQVELDRPVALKVFDEGYLERAGALERFRREAIAAGRLEHPRIVPVYDAGDVEGRAYMSMRLVPGDSLAERIARSGALPPAEAMAVLSDMAEAIDFAHARGTVHRDVKPANILLDPDGTAFLSDFGLVRLDDMPGLTRRGDWLGTAEYVSPEQIEGEGATTCSDIYALAVVAFETLTGRAPFVRREPSAVLLAHVREPVPDASSIATTLPTAVDAVLARGMAKSPDDRHGSAHELVGELRHALGSGRLRPTLVGGATPAALAADGGGDGPGDAPAPPPERPTQAFGDAARRRAMALGRDALVAAAVAAALLIAAAGVGGWLLGASSADESGAEARGFEAGRAEGFTAGRVEGKREGLQQGRAAGMKAGKNEGRKVGLAAGREQGREEGRQEGYASGLAEGRSSALGGLAPGGWYIVQVGQDGDGAVVSSSSPVASDASQCYAVRGDTVLSGEC
ncbi:serine/threonine-protein kinase [Miltoncostaea marina]|uniref:serine/threonine-protein kinase n=1 Tax=Miltoncostaea marina TaxID=2843215 RepID=UPI001C3E31EF|nr:serine/threonine-protein kinase [Miltoncostaea marina]